MDVTDALHADVYVRVSLLQQNKVVKTKRTDVVRRSVSPSFNESFTFRMPHSQPQRYQTDSAQSRAAPGASFSFRMPQSVVDVCSVSVTVLQRHSSLMRGPSYGNPAVCP